VNLRDMMREGATDADITAKLRGGIWRKPWGHRVAEGERHTVRGMSQIGG
jgi:cyclic pyranopterin phosphate synthase